MSKSTHLLIIDKFENSLLERINALENFRVDYQPELAPDRVDEQLKDAEVLLLRSKVSIDADRLNTANNLEAVIRAGAGLDEIDQNALATRGISLFSCQGANANSVGEHALGLLLGLMHHQNRASREVREMKWERESNRGTELSKKTVGIIGYGHTGRAFARKLIGFDCQLLAHDPYHPPKYEDFASAASLEQIQDEAEVISFHVPLTDETRNYYSAEFLNKMRHRHWLLNCARGEVLVLDAVLTGLSEGKLAGAGIDVLPDEKITHLSGKARDTYERLANHPDVILTPHIAGRTVESEAAINRMILAHLKQLQKR